MPKLSHRRERRPRQLAKLGRAQVLDRDVLSDAGRVISVGSAEIQLARRPQPTALGLIGRALVINDVRSVARRTCLDYPLQPSRGPRLGGVADVGFVRLPMLPEVIVVRGVIAVILAASGGAGAIGHQ